MSVSYLDELRWLWVGAFHPPSCMHDRVPVPPREVQAYGHSWDVQVWLLSREPALVHAQVSCGKEIWKVIQAAVYQPSHATIKGYLVLFIKGWQPIPWSILLCVFVIVAMPPHTPNSMGTSQFVFVFSTMLFSCQRTCQSLNGLPHPSCWFSAIGSISLSLVKSVVWLEYAWIVLLSHPLSIFWADAHTSLHTLICTHTHSHTHTHSTHILRSTHICKLPHITYANMRNLNSVTYTLTHIHSCTHTHSHAHTRTLHIQPICPHTHKHTHSYKYIHKYTYTSDGPKLQYDSNFEQVLHFLALWNSPVTTHNCHSLRTTFGLFGNCVVLLSTCSWLSER
jgi:hypothetical protein